jgi:hypothetical protein
VPSAGLGGPARFFRLNSLSHLGVTSRGCFNHRAIKAATFAAMLTEWVRM